MIGFGVAAGANIPCHALVPIPGNPCSAMVGTFGSSARRSGATVAMAFILPERICGSAEDRFRKATGASPAMMAGIRSEEHTSELQSLTNLVCRLLLEKKKNTAH